MEKFRSSSTGSRMQPSFGVDLSTSVTGFNSGATPRFSRVSVFDRMTTAFNYGVQTGDNLNRELKSLNYNREREEDNVLDDMKSYYDMVLERKRQTGNPKDGILDRIMMTGEFKKQTERPHVMARFEKMLREMSTLVRAKGMDAPTGILLLYPTQFLLVMEITSDFGRKVIQFLHDMETDQRKLVEKSFIINIGFDVERILTNFYTKILNQPMPMANWKPDISDDKLNIIAQEIIKKSFQMMTFIKVNSRDRRVMDNLIEKMAESVPDQNALLYLAKSGRLMSAYDFAERDTTPVNMTLDTEIIWPSSWLEKRLPCSVNFRSLASEHRTDISWGIGNLFDGGSRINARQVDQE